MKHLQSALLNLGWGTRFTQLEDNEVTFVIQDGPINEVGINGIQITDVLNFVCEVYKSLNADFPCRENSLTITKIEEALHWQYARTVERTKRGVEGYNKS
jgi:hypothetical protein